MSVVTALILSFVILLVQLTVRRFFLSRIAYLLEFYAFAKTQLFEEQVVKQLPRISLLSLGSGFVYGRKNGSTKSPRSPTILRSVRACHFD
jgi:hypothetical protein